MGVRATFSFPLFGPALTPFSALPRIRLKLREALFRVEAAGDVGNEEGVPILADLVDDIQGAFAGYQVSSGPKQLR